MGQLQKCSIAVSVILTVLCLTGLSAIAEDRTVRVRTSEAPLLRSADHGAEVIRTVVEGEVFTAVTEVDEFFLIKDEETESFLYLPRELVYITLTEEPDTIYISGRMPGPDRVDLSQWQVKPTHTPTGSKKLRSTPDGMLVAHNGKKYPANYDYQMDYLPQVDGSQLVNDALKYRGTKYVLGGVNEKGIDCSGLVKTCLANQGIDLVHRSSLQALEGRYVNHTDLKPGDLVYFRDRTDTRYLSHVGIYIGRGKFVHASQSAGGVVVTSLADKYFKSHYAFARRM